LDSLTFQKIRTYDETPEDETTTTDEDETTELPAVTDQEAFFREKARLEKFVSRRKMMHERFREEQTRMRMQQEVGQKITRRVAQFFENIYIVTSVSKHITENGEMDASKVQLLNAYLNHLSQFERQFPDKVGKEMMKKTLVEYGYGKE
ncbi:hypothetical protein PENTCL1PPCAC_8743, partial [Pristionchus entomophagus]